jgi:hypothetical protein
MILLLIIIFSLLYIKFGLLVLTQIILLTIIFFISNFLIGINPDNREIKVIRVISVSVIWFILIYNSELFTIKTALILPLSISKISYFEEKEIYSVDQKFETQIFKFWELELKDFINNLENNENYVVSIEFIPYFSELISEPPRLFISKPILINKHSSPTLISKFIDERLKFLVKYFDMNINILEISENDSRIFMMYQKVNF